MFTFILAAIRKTLPTRNTHKSALIRAKKDVVRFEKNSEDSTQPEDNSNTGKAVSCKSSKAPEQVTVKVEVIALKVNILDLGSETGCNVPSYSELTAWGKHPFLPSARQTRY